jgi:hypothetical protein
MIGERVFVYFDLHHLCWSLKSLKTGRVLNIDVVDGKRVKNEIQTVVLADVEFKVSAAGNQRVRDTKVKNVHAGVVGTVVSVGSVDPAISAACTFGVTYNPKLYTSFVARSTLEPVHSAPIAVLDHKKVTIPTPRSN